MPRGRPPKQPKPDGVPLYAGRDLEINSRTVKRGTLVAYLVDGQTYKPVLEDLQVGQCHARHTRGLFVETAPEPAATPPATAPEEAGPANGDGPKPRRRRPRRLMIVNRLAH